MQAFADEFRNDVALVACEKRRREEEEEYEEEMDLDLAWSLQVSEENEYYERKMKKRMKRLRDAGLGRREARERVMSELECEAGMTLPLSPIPSPTGRSAVRKVLDAEAAAEAVGRGGGTGTVEKKEKKRKAGAEEYESKAMEGGGEFLLQSVMDKVRRLRVYEGGNGSSGVVGEARGQSSEETLRMRRGRGVVRRQLCIVVE